MPSWWKKRNSANGPKGASSILVEGVTDYALFMLDPTGIVTNWNPGAQRIKGYRDTEIVGRSFENFYTAEDRAAGVPAARARDGEARGQVRGGRAAGPQGRHDILGQRRHQSASATRTAACSVLPRSPATSPSGGRRRGAAARAGAAARSRRRWRRIGQLTGGVAHDFNNLLTVIIGNLELAQRNAGRSRRAIRAARRVRSTTPCAARERAASLTQRLLAFSRRQPLEPKPVDVNRLVTGMSDLLRRTLGEQIAIETVLAGGLWRVARRPRPARESRSSISRSTPATPCRSGGKLTIETANVHLDEAYAGAQAEVAPGQYVLDLRHRHRLGHDAATSSPAPSSRSSRPRTSARAPASGCRRSTAS